MRPPGNDQPIAAEDLPAQGHDPGMGRQVPDQTARCSPITDDQRLAEDQIDSRAQFSRGVHQLGRKPQDGFIRGFGECLAQRPIQGKQSRSPGLIRFKELQGLLHILRIEQDGVQRIAERGREGGLQLRRHIERCAQGAACTPQPHLAGSIQKVACAFRVPGQRFLRLLEHFDLGLEPGVLGKPLGTLIGPGPAFLFELTGLPSFLFFMLDRLVPGLFRRLPSLEGLLIFFT